MKKTTVSDILDAKGRRKLSVLTAYDYATARILDDAGIDILLAGDSYAMVGQGHKDTLPATMEEMMMVTSGVARAARRALVVADMPFLSYQTDAKTARTNAGLFLKKAGADAVKVENSWNVKDMIKAIIDIDIPVMGHIGLTPQSVKRMGGYRIQGKDLDSALSLVRQAQELECLGVFAIVLEGIPSELSAVITGAVSVPTIGIGAGKDCDGQVLVINDLLGTDKDFTPRHARRYADLHGIISAAAARFRKDVASSAFPGRKESSPMDPGLLAELKQHLKDRHEDHQRPGKTPGNSVNIL
jgi:3-methyl-2-oxobutanoate hydroxymethyltransferase